MRKDQCPENVKRFSKELNNATVPPSPPSRPQIETAEQLDQLGIVQLNAFLVIGGRQQLERASLQSLVPNAKSIAVPEQDLHSVATAIHEQEQVTRRGVLVKDLLRSAHQAIEAVIHLRGCRA
jgi:hypothetical protein